MPNFIEHIAGEYRGGLQQCILCGAVIIDDMGMIGPSGQPERKRIRTRTGADFRRKPTYHYSILRSRLGRERRFDCEGKGVGKAGCGP